MATSKKSADASTEKVAAADIHETQNEDQPKVPEHIEGQSETPEEISEAIVNPPEPNDDEVSGTDQAVPADVENPHPADPKADRDEHTLSAPDGDVEPDKDDGKLRVARVSGDEVFGKLDAPGSTPDQLKAIRDRAKASGEGASKKASEVTN